MALRKYRYFPENDAESGGDLRGAPRLADDHDRFVASPVHDLQDNLWVLAEPAQEPDVALYPGWVRLTVPIAASVALWAPIIWLITVLRHA